MPWGDPRRGYLHNIHHDTTWLLPTSNNSHTVNQLVKPLPARWGDGRPTFWPKTWDILGPVWSVFWQLNICKNWNKLFRLELALPFPIQKMSFVYVWITILCRVWCIIIFSLVWSFSSVRKMVIFSLEFGEIQMFGNKNLESCKFDWIYGFWQTLTSFLTSGCLYF